ncbi:cysteine methyltransferase [Bacillus sp. T33-2]|nr:cysteine methyltransferase [Bacillus sp. T33-2]
MYTGYYKSPIGLIEIEASDRGLLSLLFTSNPRQDDSNDHPIINQAIMQLDEYFKGSRTDFSLQLETHGTDFQKQVWQTLKGIPFAQTYSYSEIAAMLGKEKAVRAVGNANSKNKIFIVIPCHRVLGSKGQLTGYTGELWRKEWLLNHEKNIANSPIGEVLSSTSK